MTSAQPQSSTSILRFFMPSVGDLVFLVTFWSLLMGPLANRPLADADIGWHIRAGEQILTSHSIPHTDSFSSTMEGQPWFAWEWLYDVLLGVVHRAMGLNGVVWLAAIVMATTFAVLLQQLLARGVGMPMTLLLWSLVVGAASIHMFARPHIVSWLFTLLWFVALDRWEQGSAAGWLRWFFPVSMLLWVNLHGGWLLGMALLAIYALAAVVESYRGADDFARIGAANRARGMGWSLLASAAATVVNPYGIGLHLHILRYLHDPYLMDNIAEFRSPNFHGWGQRCFVVILVLALLSAGRGRAKMRASHWMVLLLAAAGGVFGVRNLPVSSMLLVLVIGPGLWGSITSLAERPGAWQPLRQFAARMEKFSARASAQEFLLRGHMWPLAGIAASLMICLGGGRVGSNQLVNAQFDAKHLPAGAVDYLQRDGGPEPIFGPDQWGGYFIYRLYPRRQVVIDDRHDLYGSDRFRDYLMLIQCEPGWPDVLKKWHVEVMVLPADSTLASLVRKTREDWQIAYEDPVAVVLEKRH